MSRVDSRRWLPYLGERPDAEVRLFCLPYAGASAIIFRSWLDLLPASIEVLPVELPGRGLRFGEAPVSELSPLVEGVVASICDLSPKPFAFFGHSMGALLGFEIIRLLRREQRELPRIFFVSGHRAPQVQSGHEPMYSLPKDRFLQELANLNGTPAEVLNNSELMALLEPVLRADFRICETYEYRPEPPLGVPIFVFGGLHDPGVTKEDLEAWKEQTVSRFSLHLFPGGHFFLDDCRDQILQCIALEMLNFRGDRSR